MVRGSGDGPGFGYLQKPTLPAHTLNLVLSSLLRLSHQLKSFRPYSWPLDSWAVLLGTDWCFLGRRAESKRWGPG